MKYIVKVRFGYEKFILGVYTMKLKLVSFLPINGKSNRVILKITFTYLNTPTDKICITGEWCFKTESVNMSV